MLHRTTAALAAWRLATGGNFAVLFALLAPGILGLAGGAVDFGRRQALVAELQEIADTAALGGARQFHFAGSPASGAGAASTTATALANRLIAKFPMGQGAVLNATPDASERSVTVTLSKSFKPTLMVGVFRSEITVEVEAAAIAMEAARTCAVALAPAAANAIDMSGSARLTSTDCEVIANSTHADAIAATGTSEIVAARICSGGGVSGSNARFTPDPVADCPPMDDPLADRALPPDAPCGAPTPTVIADQTTTISPDVYCGLEITGTSDVTFSPGVYIIRNNDFIVADTAQISGNGVTIHFGEGDPQMRIDSGASASLTAPTAGDTAGLLISQDRDSGPGLVYRLSSNSAATLVGVIYLPAGRLVVDAPGAVASSSAFTAVVAEEIHVAGAAELVLNDDYAMTTVPAPPGLTGGADVRLRR